MKWPLSQRSLNPQLSRILALNLLLSGLLVFSGCGGGGGSTSSDFVSPTRVSSVVGSSVDIEVAVFDVTGTPIQGAVVKMTSRGGEHTVTSNAEGAAEFRNLEAGEVTVSVTATGFDPLDFGLGAVGSGTHTWHVTLHAIGAWAIGQPIVLGSHMVDRASNGSTLTFSIDLAVIDEHAESLETLTSADFSVVAIDCGWGGPRDCASDEAGNATHNFAPDGDAQDFELLFPASRRTYLVEVLAERSTAVDWEGRIPALKLFFGALGGNDAVSVSTVHSEVNGSARRTVLGPFTSDGATYFGAIDRLADPAGAQPQMMDGLLEAIRRVAAANGFGIPGVSRHVLVLSKTWMEVPEINAATDLANQLGVHISTVDSYSYGFPEMAVRTGGFVAEVYADVRQFGPIFGAMDRLLAGITPFYRMQFRIRGPAGTFVTGGNAKVNLNIRVPTTLPSNGLWATLDVDIR